MKPYIVDELPVRNLDYKSLITGIGDANAELARYDGLLQGIPNPAIMLSPLTTQEAVLSSKSDEMLTAITLPDKLKRKLSYTILLPTLA